MKAELRCAGCGRLHCTRRESPDGRQFVDVPHELTMRAIDVPRSVFEIICPACGRVERVVLTFDTVRRPRRFPKARHPRQPRGKDGGTVGWRNVSAGGPTSQTGRK